MTKKIYVLGLTLIITLLITCEEIEFGNLVGPNGGKVSGEGVTLIIPPDALKESHEFTFYK
ncbi:MAG: hypothetical protein ACUVWP_03155 [bacterium]